MPTFYLVCQNRNTLLKQTFSWQQWETCFCFQYCTKCPPGYRCPSTTSNTEIECADGTYSKGGQQDCTPCPAGYACPSKTDDFQVQCSAGYYTLGNSQVWPTIKSRSNQTASRLHWPARSTTGVYHHHQTIITIRTTLNLRLLVLGLYIFIRNGF